MTRDEIRKRLHNGDPRFNWPHALVYNFPNLLTDVALTYFVKQYPEDELSAEVRHRLQQLWLEGQTD